MANRKKSLDRVLAVQQQMVRLAEWRLGALQQQCAEIKADQVRLQEFVASEDKLSPLLSAAAFTRGQALLALGAKREAEAERQSDHANKMRRREKLAEKLVQKAQVVQDRDDEKRLLQETLEASFQKGGASFP